MSEDTKRLVHRSQAHTEIPGPLSAQRWEQEQGLIGPGLQAVVQWAKISFEHGDGPFLTDVDGNRYIDCMGGSGVNSLGHSHPRFLTALTEQLRKLITSSFPSEARLMMLRVLQSVLPAGLDRVQLYSSGTEAVEAALRLAKSYTRKYEFVSFWNGFHGKTLGSLALTDGARRGLGPVAPGMHSVPYAYCYRCPLKLRFPECGFACVEFAREALRHQSAEAIAGIVVEPVQGRAGNVVPPPGYLKALQSVAREFDALLIADESITGFGRTGQMFGCASDEVVPDIIIIGKGMGNGFPVTGIVSSQAVMSASPFSDPSASSSSFGGFPLACTAVGTAVEIIRDERLVERSAEQGAALLAMLKPLEELGIVGEVRGRGLMIGIELVEDQATRQPASKDLVRQVYLALMHRGVLVMTGGNSLRLYPPLTINADVTATTAETLHAVLRQCAQTFVTGRA